MHMVALKNSWCDQELLLQEFNNYNTDAFEYIFKTNYRALTYYALEHTGSRMAAEDIVQSVFIRLWKNRNKFDSIYALKSFLYISVRNGSIDEKKRIAITIKSGKNNSGNIAGGSESLSEEELARILDAETLGILYHSIFDLPPVCRRIMMMSLSGRKNAEISQILKISVNTVRAHKQKAIIRLREMLPPELGLLLLILTFCEAE